MAAIGQRTRWAPPPTAKVDPSHPLAKSLAFITVGDVDLATGMAPVRTSRAGVGVTNIGKAVAASTAANVGGALRWQDHPNLSSWTIPFTVAAWGTLTGTSGYGHWGFGCPNNSPSVAAWPFSWYSGSGGSDMRPAFGGGGGFYFPSLGLSISDGAPHLLVCSVDPTNATTYKDGVQVGSGAHGRTTLTQATSPWELWPAATDGGTLNQVSSGACSFAAVWKRPLSAAEVAQLNADPFQMLRW